MVYFSMTSTFLLVFDVGTHYISSFSNSRRAKILFLKIGLPLDSSTNLGEYERCISCNAKSYPLLYKKENHTHAIKHINQENRQLAAFGIISYSMHSCTYPISNNFITRNRNSSFRKNHFHDSRATWWMG